MDLSSKLSNEKFPAIGEKGERDSKKVKKRYKNSATRQKNFLVRSGAIAERDGSTLTQIRDSGADSQGEKGKGRPALKEIKNKQTPIDSLTDDGRDLCRRRIPLP